VNELKVNGRRLWDSLMELGKIGETEKGGSRRLALSDLDKEGRELVIGWMKAAGMTITVDSLGNIFGRRAGQDNSLPPVMTGSHIDTQPSGGKFDGCYGVMAGLEVVRTIADAGLTTRAPIELAIWTNEEGARFVPTMMGSGVFCGSISPEAALNAKDAAGVTIGEELKRLGYDGSEPVGIHPVGSYFEAHIEQGPILEADRKTIGVVTGVLGIRLINVTVSGVEAHAGPTPMEIRKDALYACAPVFTEIIDIAKEFAPVARATIGEVNVLPGSRNTIPGCVRFSVDLRHLDPAKIDEMVVRAREICKKAEERTGIAFKFDELQSVVPTQFDTSMIEIVRQAAAASGYTYQEMISGAGHDACNMAKIAPTSMIFVPCRDGLSHNEAEWATSDDLEAGANILLSSMIKRANA